VRVASEKPDVYADVEAVGVEVFLFKRGQIPISESQG
jgi:hypothetical protein